MNKMKFGSHVSIKKGYLSAAKEAYAMHASAFQYLPKNPRSLSRKDFSKEDAELCKVFCEENGLESVVHSPYLTNLTSKGEQKKQQVIDSLVNDLEIVDACGFIGVVVHFGKKISNNDPLTSYQVMIDMLDEVPSKWEGKAKILLENNAGKAGTIGTTMEELVEVRQVCEEAETMGVGYDS